MHLFIQTTLWEGISFLFELWRGTLISMRRKVVFFLEALWLFKLCISSWKGLIVRIEFLFSKFQNLHANHFKGSIFEVRHYFTTHGKSFQFKSMCWFEMTWQFVNVYQWIFCFLFKISFLGYVNVFGLQRENSSRVLEDEQSSSKVKSLGSDVMIQTKASPHCSWTGSVFSI